MSDPANPTITIRKLKHRKEIETLNENQHVRVDVSSVQKSGGPIEGETIIFITGEISWRGLKFEHVTRWNYPSETPNLWNSWWTELKRIDNQLYGSPGARDFTTEVSLSPNEGVKLGFRNHRSMNLDCTFLAVWDDELKLSREISLKPSGLKVIFDALAFLEVE